MIEQILPKVSRIFLAFLLPIASISVASAQEVKKPKLSGESKVAREQSIRMLDNMKDILKEYYYDPKYRGIDLDKRIEAAKERVKTMEYNWRRAKDGREVITG